MYKEKAASKSKTEVITCRSYLPRCTCYDMATYPCIYVYDAPGIKPSSL